MDNQDIKIKSLLTSISDDTVPFGFDKKVYDKIQIKAAVRESRRETLHNYVTLIIIALIFSGALLLINYYYFNIELSFKADFSFFAEKVRSTSELFTSSDSLLWIGIGTNIALLLLCERVVSERLNKRHTEKN